MAYNKRKKKAYKAALYGKIKDRIERQGLNG